MGNLARRAVFGALAAAGIAGSYGCSSTPSIPSANQNDMPNNSAYSYTDYACLKTVVNDRWFKSDTVRLDILGIQGNVYNRNGINEAVTIAKSLLTAHKTSAIGPDALSGPVTAGTLRSSFRNSHITATSNRCIVSEPGQRGEAFPFADLGKYPNLQLH